jgi:hypothetical protein
MIAKAGHSEHRATTTISSHAAGRQARSIQDHKNSDRYESRLILRVGFLSREKPYTKYVPERVVMHSCVYARAAPQALHEIWIVILWRSRSALHACIRALLEELIV